MISSLGLGFDLLCLISHTVICLFLLVVFYCSFTAVFKQGVPQGLFSGPIIFIKKSKTLSVIGNGSLKLHEVKVASHDKRKKNHIH